MRKSFLEYEKEKRTVKKLICTANILHNLKPYETGLFRFIFNNAGLEDNRPKIML